MLVPAIARITARFGRAPDAVTADRGYGEAKVDAELVALGVKRVAIPRRGRPGAARQQVQRGRAFIKLVKWRTGSEARISHQARLRPGALARRRHRRHPGVVRVGRARPQRHKVSALIEDAGTAIAPVAQAAVKRPAHRGTGPPRKR